MPVASEGSNGDGGHQMGGGFNNRVVDCVTDQTPVSLGVLVNLIRMINYIMHNEMIASFGWDLIHNSIADGTYQTTKQMDYNE